MRVIIFINHNTLTISVFGTARTSHGGCGEKYEPQIIPCIARESRANMQLSCALGMQTITQSARTYILVT